MRQIEQAKQDGRSDGLATPIEKYPTDAAARHKARLENLKKITEKAKQDKARAKEMLDRVRVEMKAAGVYDKYKQFVEAIDGMCSGDTLDSEDTNID